ncbi:MAG TPA: AI-2E family transporter [Gammaproteobacteria bacterium]|nr:AI-2E family transporter [Gammaproteobacteria bacterium]
MSGIINRWIKKYFSDPEAVILAVLLVLGFAIVIFLGDILMPVLASLVIAYMLEGSVKALEKRGAPRIVAVSVVFSGFVTSLVLILFVLIPLVSSQLTQLVQELPNMVAKGQQALLQLPELYPRFITEAQVKEAMAGIKSGVADVGQAMLSMSLTTLTGLFTLLVYLILVPVLVFFFLKDKGPMVSWLSGMLPRERALATRVWREMDQQIGNYIRGKIVEILIVGVVTGVVFALMGLRYSMLLGVLVGLSVIIPYIGAVVVTFPVVIIAFFQWGWGADFTYVLVAYFIIQAVDGNVLVPWLFSEAVNLHPVAIIVAILIFGGFWGFWGVFFAIPLATLVKAVLNAWPRSVEE